MTDNLKDLLNNTESLLQKTKLDNHKITETIKKDTRLIISAFEGITQLHSGEKLNGPLHDGYNDLDPNDPLVEKSLKKTHTELTRTHKQNAESIDHLQKINDLIDVFFKKMDQFKKKLNENVLNEKLHRKIARTIKNSRMTEEQEEVLKYSLLQKGGIRRRRRRDSTTRKSRKKNYSNKTRK